MLLGELRQRGYSGSYTILRYYLQPLREAARSVAVRRIETRAGKQAQLDWGYLGEIDEKGRRRKLWAFVFTLGHSRAMMAAVATDQKLSTLLRPHEEAFRQLGGVPEEILYDRRTAVIEGTDERGETRRAFAEFARYWGFRPRAAKPYRAQTKGKVESGVKHVRRNFLCGRTATSLADLPSATRWAVRGTPTDRHSQRLPLRRNRGFSRGFVGACNCERRCCRLHRRWADLPRLVPASG